MSPEARERSFDALAKGLASGTVSRGKALKLMGATLVGGALASVPGIAWAAPKPRPNGRRCKTNSQCVSQNCVDRVCQAGGGDPEPTCTPSCPEGEECIGQEGTPPFCVPICTPSCPEGVCQCVRSGDGSGNVCVAFGASPVVSSCDQCPTADFPENTICRDQALSPPEFLTCERPCPQ